MTGHELLLLSARTEQDLRRCAADLGAALRDTTAELADVAYTLAVGRRRHPHRAAVVAASAADAAHRLTTGDWITGDPAPAAETVFLLPGQGIWWLGMGVHRYANDPRFRVRLDEAAAALAEPLGRHPLEPLFDPHFDAAEHTDLAQPVVFMLQHALATHLRDDCGVRPTALLGHSLGEVTAACLAGVFDLADAARMVTARGRLMQQTAPGGLLAVALPAADVPAHLTGELCLAADNGPRSCLVSGPADEVDALAGRLRAAGVAHRRLRGSRAFHSSLMDPVLDEFTDVVAQLKPRPPQLPTISNVTGAWLTDEQATDPAYWAAQLRSTVRFADGAATALGTGEHTVAVDVGPGRVLADLVRSGRRPLRTVTALDESGDEDTMLLEALAGLWVAGADLDGAVPAAGRRRVSLPTYPFARTRHWIDGRFTRPQPAEPEPPADRLPLSRWLWQPVWRELPPPPAPAGGSWLILGDPDGIAGRLHALVSAAGGTASLAGDDAPADAAGYEQILRAAGPVDHVVCCRAYGTPVGGHDDLVEDAFYAPLWLGQALAGSGAAATLHLISSHTHRVDGADPVVPERALLLGQVRVLGLEHPSLACRNLDLPGDGPAADAELAWRWLAAGEPVVAVRAGVAYAQDTAAVDAPAHPGSPIRPGGHYLITGGLGGVGSAIAAWLTGTHQARVTLTGRTPATAAASRLAALRASLGADARLTYRAADLADETAMRAVLDDSEHEFGELDGVFHCAGTAGAGLIAQKTRAEAAGVLASKVAGTAVLARLLAGRRPAFVLLCSSHNALLGRFGQVDYCAANAYLDAFADAQAAAGEQGAATRWISVNWDVWSGAGMAVDTDLPEQLRAWRAETLRHAIRPGEAGPVIDHVLAAGLPRTVVSTRDFGQVTAGHEHSERDRLQRALRHVAASKPVTARAQTTAETAPAQPPTDPLTARVAAVWQELLGVAHVGPHDSFLELGGHSLIATMLLARLRRDLGIDLTLRAFLDRPTVAAIVAAKQGASAQPAGSAARPAVSPAATIPAIALTAAPRRRRPAAQARSPQLSLMFFAADEATAADDRYGLLLRAARFADENGLHAVWLPERHFNGFGGLYPNPSVLAAAVAPMTSRVRLRAGSVISPLHTPLRIAEEWSVVDNLSRGRVDLSFGSGWHVNDFVLAPGRYADRKHTVLGDIDTVRRLWRGEAVTVPNGVGAPTPTRTFPRPVQPDLSVWLTGESPDTFATAGRQGHNILTALMHQDLDALAANITAYRAERQAHGHDRGHVTLMQHTFVVPDLDEHRARLHDGYARYIRTNLTLQLDNAAGLGSPDAGVTEQDVRTLAERNLGRLIDTTGMIGSRDAAGARLERLAGIGVDEVACLIDFFPDTELIETGLPQLAELASRAGRPDVS